MAKLELNSNDITKYLNQILNYKGITNKSVQNYNELKQKIKTQLQQNCVVKLERSVIVNKNLMNMSEIHEQSAPLCVDGEMNQKQEDTNELALVFDEAAKEAVNIILQQEQQEKELLLKTQIREEEAAELHTTTTIVNTSEITKYNDDSNIAENVDEAMDNRPTTTVVISVPRILGTAIYDNAVSLNFGEPHDLITVLAPRVRNLINAAETNETLNATNYLQQINSGASQTPNIAKKKRTYKRKTSTVQPEIPNQQFMADGQPVKKKRGRKPKNQTIKMTTTTTTTATAAMPASTLKEYLENMVWNADDPSDALNTNTLEDGTTMEEGGVQLLIPLARSKVVVAALFQKLQ